MVCSFYSSRKKCNKKHDFSTLGRAKRPKTCSKLKFIRTLESFIFRGNMKRKILVEEGLFPECVCGTFETFC